MTSYPPAEVTCPAGHTVVTSVRRRSIHCRCGLTFYVRQDGTVSDKRDPKDRNLPPVRPESVVTDPDGLDYLRWLEVRHMSGHTLANRRRILARLEAREAAPRRLLQLGYQDLYRWIGVRYREVGPSTLVNEISAIQCFFRWAVREGRIDVDPSARLDRPRMPRRVPQPIGDVDLARAMADAPVDMVAMLALAAFAGLRCVEIARLSWADVHLGEPGHVFVRAGKGGHQRQVPMALPLRAALEALPHRVGPVIPRRDGQPGHNSPHVVSHRIADHMKACGIGATAHKGRHRFGTAVYAATKDLLMTQQLMGHASVQTTQQYVRVDLGSAASAVAAAAEVHIA